MAWKPQPFAWNRSLRVTLLSASFLALYFSRRWEQLISPQVWDEDGYLLAGFIEKGWHEFLLPLNGYLVLVAKIISRSALAVSIYYYPAVSTVMAAAFCTLCGLGVAMAPTRLNGKLLCAFAVFLLPTNAEAYGPPLYTISWAPILLLLVSLWDEKDAGVSLRLAVVILAGLSSPLVIVVLPVLCLRAVCHRANRSETIIAIAATVVAALQFYFIRKASSGVSPPLTSLLWPVVSEYCGRFLVGNIYGDNEYLLWTLGVLVTILMWASCWRRRDQLFIWILLYLFYGSTLSSIYRAYPAIPHPVLAGPRYFFSPYILTFWILIQLICATGVRWLRIATSAVVAVAVLNAIPVWSRRHDDLHWAEHLVSGRLFPRYNLPIEFDGIGLDAWTIEEDPRTWGRFIERDWFLSPGELENLPTFAYRIIGPGDTGVGWDPVKPAGAGGTIRGESIAISAGMTVKDVELRLFRGSRVHFRSGRVKEAPSMEVVGYESVFIPRLPITNGWVTMDFSNSRLPDAFIVRIKDRGQGVGEWSLANHAR